jgi:hypothetical protein
MLHGSGLIGCDYKMMQSDVYERDDIEGVPTSPYIVREAGLQVDSGREYKSSTSRSPLYSAGLVQLPIRVLLLRSPCASRQQVPYNASRVVPGAHRVVGPGTHRGSGPREVHTTSTDPRATKCCFNLVAPPLPFSLRQYLHFHPARPRFSPCSHTTSFADIMYLHK